jgi:sugar O-acyltransferase (sialic acid O-acetyltransferase NeuD family)
VKEIYGVFGAGGYGREVMPLARKHLQKNDIPIECLFFVVDHPETDQVNDVQVISLSDFIALKAEKKYLTCAVADSKFRAEFKNRIHGSELHDWTLIAENSVIMDGVNIGLGSILSPFVTITSNVRIGSSFHANLYSYVGHDCVIGDFVTFAPGVKCNGNVVIESFAYLGAGAIVRPGRTGKPLRIGEGAIIGIGAIVTKDVPSGVTVFGNPAKIIKRAK